MIELLGEVFLSEAILPIASSRARGLMVGWLANASVSVKDLVDNLPVLLA